MEPSLLHCRTHGLVWVGSCITGAMQEAGVTAGGGTTTSAGASEPWPFSREDGSEDAGGTSTCCPVGAVAVWPAKLPACRITKHLRGEDSESRPPADSMMSMVMSHPFQGSECHHQMRCRQQIGRACALTVTPLTAASVRTAHANCTVPEIHRFRAGYDQYKAQHCPHHFDTGNQESLITCTGSALALWPTATRPRYKDVSGRLLSQPS